MGWVSLQQTINYFIFIIKILLLNKASLKHYLLQGAADVRWKDNWITFLDALLQTSVFADKGEGLRLPTSIRYLYIDPNTHMDHVRTNEGYTRCSCS